MTSSRNSAPHNSSSTLSGWVVSLARPDSFSKFLSTHPLYPRHQGIILRNRPLPELMGDIRFLMVFAAIFLVLSALRFSKKLDCRLFASSSVPFNQMLVRYTGFGVLSHGSAGTRDGLEAASLASMVRPQEKCSPRFPGNEH